MSSHQGQLGLESGAEETVQGREGSVWESGLCLGLDQDAGLPGTHR